MENTADFREQVEKQPDYRYDVRNEIIINNDTMIFEEEYNVKVLMLNGSAKANGNTYASLLEVGRQLEKEGIEYEIFQMGREAGQRLSGLRSVYRERLCVCR